MVQTTPSPARAISTHCIFALKYSGSSLPADSNGSATRLCKHEHNYSAGSLTCPEQTPNSRGSTDTVHTGTAARTTLPALESKKTITSFSVISLNPSNYNRDAWLNLILITILIKAYIYSFRSVEGFLKNGSVLHKTCSRDFLFTCKSDVCVV